MQIRRSGTITRIKTSTVILAIIALCGVLAMAYGYFYNDLKITYTGIFISFVASFAMMIITTVIPHHRHIMSRKNRF
jgi:hypothetical protein